MPGQYPHCNSYGCDQCRERGPWRKPGRGVGTGPMTIMDGVTLQRIGHGLGQLGYRPPDMEGRGTTDHSTDLNPNLMPDKVKGQMSPGGSMPSITLKG